MRAGWGPELTICVPRGVGLWSSEDEGQNQQLQYQDEEEDGGAQGPQHSERETL